MQLGELIEKMTTSDRLVIITAAGQVIYRGYAANFAHGTINPLRRVKRFGLGMFGGIRHGERKESMADARIAGNGSCCPITAPEMVAENGSR